MSGRRGEDGFAARLAARLAAREPVRRGEGRHTPAAVLIALFAEPASGAPHVWLVRRADRMRVHRGEVALPGGKRDPEDESLLHTALREAHEEIGLSPEAPRVLGALDDLVTITGYVVTPWVAWLAHPFEPRAAPGEVARVFAAPVATFERPGRANTALGEALRRVVLSYEVDGETVWGATAAILRDLARHTRGLD